MRKHNTSAINIRQLGVQLLIKCYPRSRQIRFIKNPPYFDNNSAVKSFIRQKIKNSMYAPHPPSPSSPFRLVIVCLGQLRSLDLLLCESTARRDVRYTSAASCSVCCTENSFPRLRPAPRTSPQGSQNFQTTNDSRSAIQGRLASLCLRVWP